MIPFTPYAAAEHRTRWPAATTKVWDFANPDAALEVMGNRPGMHPEHIFDFYDGLRLIVSTDRYSFGTYLHVSASAEPGSTIYRRIAHGQMKMAAFSVLVRERVQFLAGVDVHFGYESPGKGIPHYFHPPLGDA